MKPVLVALGITCVGVACIKARRPGVMTKERDAAYRRCISGQVKDPDELDRYANAFEKARLFPQALLIRQRAALRRLPDDVKAKRREIFRKAMRSKNKLAVIRCADAFESQGATTAAYRLRQYASGLPDVGPDGRPMVDPGPIVTPPPEAPDQPAPESDEPVKHDTDPAPPNEMPIHLNGQNPIAAE